MVEFTFSLNQAVKFFFPGAPSFIRMYISASSGSTVADHISSLNWLKGDKDVLERNRVTSYIVIRFTILPEETACSILLVVRHFFHVLKHIQHYALTLFLGKVMPFSATGLTTGILEEEELGVLLGLVDIVPRGLVMHSGDIIGIVG